MPDYLPKWRYMEAGIFGLMMSFAMCDIYIDTVRNFPYTGKAGYAEGFSENYMDTQIVCPFRQSW